MLKIYHQTGHNFNWNVDSVQEDGCGQGLIFSPVHQNPKQVAKVAESLRTNSYFDPQFYLPSSQKPKFKEYEFFPETASGGFSTTSFEAQAIASAKQCVKFQVEQGFRKIVIPTRFLQDLYTDYIDRQRVFSVDAFIDVASSNDLCMSIALTPAMIEDKVFRQKLLNWVSSYPEVSELYVMYAFPRETKQIQDPNFLLSFIRFAQEVQDTGLELLIGYLNVESLVLSVLGDVSLTVGTFENTRMFSLDKFLVSEEERRGPKARIYLPGLFNWIQIDQAKFCRSSLPAIWKKIHQDSQYSEAAFQMAVEPTFGQPQLYRHHFVTIQNQFDALQSLDSKGRKELLLDWLGSAKSNYSTLAKSGVEFERHGRGGHIDPWIKVLTDLSI
jgi:hypothetical protein